MLSDSGKDINNSNYENISHQRLAFRSLPFERMLYFGESETDVPCMSVVKEQCGHSIAVYGLPRKKATALRLIKEACKADYTEKGEIYATVCRIFDKIRVDNDFGQLVLRTDKAI